MTVICKHCGKENTDPGGDLSTYRCGHCQKGPLIRITQEPEKAGKIVGSGLGAAVGAGIAGPIGAIVGALIGFAIGNKADEESKK
jgi:hypothetical protein